MFFFQQLDSFYEKFKRLKDYKPESDEILAGVNRFDRYKSFNTLKFLAREMGKTYDEILHLTASEIYMTLIHDMDTSLYMRDLRKIKEMKKPKS